jgi:hypothetical protein
MYIKFKVCKSVHHHTIQINQPTRCNNLSSLLYDVIYSLTCFGRPHAHPQELNNCSSSLWFNRWSVVIAVLLVVVDFVSTNVVIHGIILPDKLIERENKFLISRRPLLYTATAWPHWLLYRHTQFTALHYTLTSLHTSTKSRIGLGTLVNQLPSIRTTQGWRTCFSLIKPYVITMNWGSRS